jgi:hypothetical protein
MVQQDGGDCHHQNISNKIGFDFRKLSFFGKEKSETKKTRKKEKAIISLNYRLYNLYLL